MVEVTKAKKIAKSSQDPVIGSTEIQQVTMRNENSESDHVKEEIEMVLEAEAIEEIIESGDDINKNDNESVSDAPRQTQPDEEELVVRRKLCRGCHSDGAFWSLQTTTEGDTYEDLLQIYFNIQLCQVSHEEEALSGICALCAARLREARAFSAQAGAAEERFTRLYKENRVRVLGNEEIIKEGLKIFNKVVVNEDVIKKEVPETFHGVLVNEENIKKEVPDMFNEDVPEAASLEESTQKHPDKPAPKKLRLSITQYERVGNLFKCPRCENLYRRSYINYHVKTHHTISEKNKSKKAYQLTPSDFERIGKSYKCIRCEKEYDIWSKLRTHIMYTHLKLPRYKCPHCDKTFQRHTVFNKHKFEEHAIDDRIKCNACDWSTFRTKSALTKHKNIFHMLGEKQTCPDCDYVCFSEIILKRHAIKHSTVKEHHCKYCKKSFLRKNNLVFHERIHTGDKRQVCNVCGQAFVQRASLKYHMAKHHPEVRS